MLEDQPALLSAVGHYRFARRVAPAIRPDQREALTKIIAFAVSRPHSESLNDILVRATGYAL